MLFIQSNVVFPELLKQTLQDFEYTWAISYMYHYIGHSSKHWRCLIVYFYETFRRKELKGMVFRLAYTIKVMIKLLLLQVILCVRRMLNYIYIILITTLIELYIHVLFFIVFCVLVNMTGWRRYGVSSVPSLRYLYDQTNIERGRRGQLFSTHSTTVTSFCPLRI